MADRDVFNLIFLPGFSTADKVTNVSGRGVGMDVVKTNVERINGAIELQSSQFTLSKCTLALNADLQPYNLLREKRCSCRLSPRLSGCLRGADYCGGRAGYEDPRRSRASGYARLFVREGGKIPGSGLFTRPRLASHATRSPQRAESRHCPRSTRNESAPTTNSVCFRTW